MANPEKWKGLDAFGAIVGYRIAFVQFDHWYKPWCIGHATHSRLNLCALACVFLGDPVGDGQGVVVVRSNGIPRDIYICTWHILG